LVRGWRSKELRLVLPAIAFERRHPIFRGGHAFSLGAVGPPPGWLVL